jgi:peptidoglycan hydrolase-like protein with peptidoglycan-binding domain
MRSRLSTAGAAVAVLLGTVLPGPAGSSRGMRPIAMLFAVAGVVGLGVAAGTPAAAAGTAAARPAPVTHAALPATVPVTAPGTAADQRAAAVTLAAAPAWPLVQQGQQGAQVRTVQYLLNNRGEALVPDGVFGSLTLAAVKRFQSANGLDADGIVGPLTWPVLVVPLAAGASGPAVMALQVQLNRYGAGLAVDGEFGPATAGAVTAFKAEHGLGTGSAVDVTVWQWLVGGIPTVGGYALPLPHGALPRTEYDDPHHDYPAIDLPVPTGTPAYASASGTVQAVNDSSCGTGVVITDANSVRHIFCHFSQRVVAGGARVTAGDLVGYTGATGNVTGPHLHFGIKTGSTSRCPQRFLLALYDGVTPPAPATLPTTGCYYATLNPQPPLLDYLR